MKRIFITIISLVLALGFLAQERVQAAELGSIQDKCRKQVNNALWQIHFNTTRYGGLDFSLNHLERGFRFPISTDDQKEIDLYESAEETFPHIAFRAAQFLGLLYMKNVNDPHLEEGLRAVSAEIESLVRSAPPSALRKAGETKAIIFSDRGRTYSVDWKYDLLLVDMHKPTFLEFSKNPYPGTSLEEKIRRALANQEGFKLEAGEPASSLFP